MSASVEKVLDRLGIEGARLLGSRWWAPECPMPGHGAQNPKHRYKNWFIKADGISYAGAWHCFSCGAGGTLVELVMALRGLEFREAMAWLGDVEEAPAPEPVVSVRYELAGARRFAMPAGVEHSPFAEWNSVPREYAASRGLDAEQVARWDVGFAFEGRLRGRIVFPIRDERGAPANYAARTFVGDETRYLAAHSSEGPDTSAMLGEHFWPASLIERATSSVVVFEGALSGMALDRLLRTWRRRPFVAGLQGSAVDHRRAAKLATFGHVVVATDPDDAGDEAWADVAHGLRSSTVLVSRLRYPHRGVDAADTPPGELAPALFACIGPAASSGQER